MGQGVRHRWMQVAAFVAILLPWLNPFYPGPSTMAVSLLSAALFWPLLILARPGVRTVGAAWAVAAVLSAVFALLQHGGWAASLAPWISPAAMGEAYANLRQRNLFATLTSMGLVALLLQDRPRWALAPAVALLALANGATSSRTGMVQCWLIGLGCLLAAWWPGRRAEGAPTLCEAARRRAGLGLLVLVVHTLSRLLLPWMSRTPQRAESAWTRLIEPNDCESRLALWSNVADLIRERPWSGWGWGELDFAHYSTLYTGTRFCSILDNAHNLPLQLAVELGLPVAVVVLLLGGFAVWRGRPWRADSASARLGWAVLALIGLHSLLEYPLWYGPFLTAALLSSSLIVWPQTKAPPSEALSVETPPLRWLALALVVAIGVGYTAWDYVRVSQVFLPKSQRLAPFQQDTLAKAKETTLFQPHARFAELTMTSVTSDNAAPQLALALETLHFSPEARVIERVLDSALWLGDGTTLAFHLPRYRAAYPEAAAQWELAQAARLQTLRDQGAM